MKVIDRAWRGARNDWRLYLLSAFSVAVAFVCLASALLVVFNVAALRERWSEQGQISVYLRAAASEQQTTEIEQAVRRTPGVLSVQRVSAERARSDLADSSADPLVAGLPAEAFPASLEVRLQQGDLDRLHRLAAQLSQLPAVEAIETYEAWRDRLGQFLRGGMTATFILALVVLIAVASVVSSTMRLALERRRLEIEVLKMVGATDAFVRRPFLVEGAAQGALGALLAGLLVALLYAVARGQYSAELGTLVGVSPTFLPWWALLGMVGLGAVLGGAAAFASLRRLLLV